MRSGDVCSKGKLCNGLHVSQCAFPYDTLVRLVDAFYSVFKLPVALRQLLYYFVGAARDVATDCGGDLHELADPKFVRRHRMTSNQAVLSDDWASGDAARAIGSGCAAMILLRAKTQSYANPSGG